MVSPANMPAPQVYPTNRVLGHVFPTSLLPHLWAVPQEKDFALWRRFFYTQWISPLTSEEGSVRPIIEAHRLVYGDTDSAFVAIKDDAAVVTPISKKRKRESSGSEGREAKRLKVDSKKRKREDEGAVSNKRPKLDIPVQGSKRKRLDVDWASYQQKRQRVI